MDRDALIAGLGELLEKESDVLVAYLYGSQATDTSWALSDIDVAVLLREGGDLFARRLALIGAAAELVGEERTDVVLLNDAPVSLAYRVVRDGEIMLCRDDRARAEHRLLTITKYMDMEPMRRTLACGRRWGISTTWSPSPRRSRNTSRDRPPAVPRDREGGCSPAENSHRAVHGADRPR